MPIAFVAGATGTLGGLIVESLRRRDVQVRALVRPGNAEGRQALDGRPGVEVVEGDIRDSVDSLGRTLDGVGVVISAVLGDADVIVDGQVNLLRAAEKAGVARFIPSDFSYDLFRLDPDDNAYSNLRLEAHKAFGESPVAVTSVLPGAFLDVVHQPYFEHVDWEAGTFSYWGDGDQPIEFTSYADTAEWTAEVALDPTPGPTVRVAADILTTRGLHQTLERASGRRLEPRRLGGLDDLKAEIERRKAGSTNVFDYLALQYAWVMNTGKASFDRLDNDRYPGVEPTRAEEFYRRALNS
ncbi:NmrA family NAD(P)-binding protein [Actinophytocola gossypii]|uniref:NmrA family NAD(P)-binding protein n=1 Tax=Actinophytocola gossypii TaxID=2812003 RepID=A0ABT2J781_9PSEU|nr:NmrA family NAD(P)-binding protein [Actinophytocola gossypii]MCT2583710.1 NmrA family NAD(P)-binding protein [Actinophytocola gossypii]